MLSFREFEKIDAHMHYNCRRHDLLDFAQEQNFRLLTINAEVPFFPSLEEQREIPFALAADYRHTINFVVTFSTEDWGKPGWQNEAIEQIKIGLDRGAVGVKVWKNVGMSLKDNDGNFIMIDDPSFDPVFGWLEEHHVPLLGHLGEPRNCWLPVGEMTVDSDKAYFSAHPEYHMYKHPEFPSYEQQMEARDHMLDKHPDLIFIGAHLASLEWSVDRIAAWLKKYPNTAVDLAERVCHLQYQSVAGTDKVRDFMIRYQDRILYGTDLIDDGNSEPEGIIEEMSNRWENHWKFFTTSELLHAPEFKEPFHGLALPDEALKKIYAYNAQNWYPNLVNGK